MGGGYPPTLLKLNKVILINLIKLVRLIKVGPNTYLTF